MSAYVVSDKTINRILAAIDYSMANASAWDVIPQPKMFELPPVGDKKAREKALARIGRRLRKLNETAVLARYDDLSMIPNEPFVYERLEVDSPIQVSKTLSCFLYQCCEGNVPENVLYKTLDAWERNICRWIVHQLDEWDRADWG